MDDAGVASPIPREAVRPSGYSDVQLEIIRAALNAHCDVAVLSDGKGLSWAAAAVAIEEYTDVKMGEEVLRRFAKGLGPSGKRGEGGRPKAENIQAIVDYLAHSDIQALSLESLENERLDFQAPVHLIYFFRQKIDEDVIKAPSCLSGSYFSKTFSANKLFRSRLRMNVAEDTGVIHADEYLEVSGLTGHDENNRKIERTHVYRGWGVVTPEDNIFVFLKDETYGANRYYSLAAYQDMWSVRVVDYLVLSKADYPHELEGGETEWPQAASEIAQKFQENLFVFIRTSDDKTWPQPVQGTTPGSDRPDGDAGGPTTIEQQYERELQRLFRSGLSRSEATLLVGAKHGDEELIESVESFADFSVRDPRTGASALHYVAAYSARPAFRALLNTEACDFLIRDNLGRLPSEMASVYGRDPAMARLLRRKELQQAQDMGLEELPFRAKFEEKAKIVVGASGNRGRYMGN